MTPTILGKDADNPNIAVMAHLRFEVYWWEDNKLCFIRKGTADLAQAALDNFKIPGAKFRDRLVEIRIK